MLTQSINIQFVSTSSIPFTAPVQRVTLLDSSNPQFLRQVMVSNDGVRIIRGQYTIQFPMQQLFQAAISASPSMSWAPYIITNPVSQTAASSSASYFNITASAESPITYQWYSQASGSIGFGVVSSSAPYLGETSSSLFINPCTGLDQFQYLCVASDVSGQTTSSIATLTVI